MACWTGQIYKHFADPKPACIADWADMPEWQRETDPDIFEHIEKYYAPHRVNGGPDRPHSTGC